MGRIPEASAVRPDQSRLPLVALIVGVWAIVPPYVVLFGELRVSSLVEFVDHAIPGFVVIAAAVLGHLQLRRSQPAHLVLFLGGGFMTLAGLWMLSTHAGLINETRLGNVPGGAVAWHFAPGLAVLLLGGVWTARFWGSDETSTRASVER